MKSVLYMLIASLFFNACGENLCYESNIEEINIEGSSLVNEHQPATSNSITKHKCHIINQWLNRKSIGHFLKSYISLESEMSSINKRTHINDTFIP